VNPSLRLMLGLAAAATATALGAWTLARLRWRRKSPEELERLRRLDVNRRGRIAPAQIVDIVESEVPAGPGHLIVYKYEVGGVTYEVAQDVWALPQVALVAAALAGHPASIKYDTRQPSNSILACEEWSGIKESSH
jgi:hypothetical protein